jgi:hypothetical protein
MKSYNHCKSSVHKFGGEEDDYLEIHQWFDETKNPDGKKVITRSIAEQHIREDLGFIPSVQDWLKCIKPELWMESTKRVKTAKMHLG